MRSRKRIDSEVLGGGDSHYYSGSPPNMNQVTKMGTFLQLPGVQERPTSQLQVSKINVVK